MSTFKKFTGVSTGALVAALAFSMPAGAQTSEIIDNEDGTSEVIVTVERRAQSLQDYAGTAAVITGDELKLLGVTDFQDVDGKIPGLSIANNQGNIEVWIRGVGSSNNTELGDPAAAFHFNDVYLPRPAGIGSAFFDIERVEVNIGPQGTLRGRNATAGSINAIPWKPYTEEFQAQAEIGVGNYGETTFEGMINAPLGENTALRIAGLKTSHDSYYTNVSPCSAELGLDIPTCEAEGIEAPEAADNLGLRAALMTRPTDRITVTLTADYNEGKGTGYTGTNYANPLGNGIDPEDIDDPRDVFARGITPEENTVHEGIKGHFEYEGNGWKAEYIASFRDLIYDYEFIPPLGPNYDGAADTFEPADYDNFSRVRFTTDSESTVNEFRLSSDNDSALLWSAGLFLFGEEQRTFLGTTGDRNPFFQGVEFNQTTSTDSYSIYGDATYSVNDQIRLTGGLRYTNDEKERFGINARYAFGFGGPNFDCCFANGVASGTEGFEFAGLNRDIIIPDTNADGLVDAAESIAFLFDGIQAFGARDGFDNIFPNGQQIQDAFPNAADRQSCDAFAFVGSCENFVPDFNGRPDFTLAPFNSTFAPQSGRLENDFVDWRLRAEYDVTPDNLIYGLVATGNKSGGFNDNIPGTEGFATNPAQNAPVGFDTDTLAPTYDEEQLTLFELGSKNQFEWNGLPITLNASAFYYDYKDLQLTSLTSTSQVLDREGVELSPEDLEGLGGNVVAFTFNASDAEIYGAQFDGEIDFPGDVTFKSTLLWLPEARVTGSDEIQDSRYQADVDVRDSEGNPINAVNRSIEGNRLIKTPEIQLNGSLSKAIEFDHGIVDGVFSFGYRSEQNMTIFNGIDYNPDDDTDFRLNDEVEGYWTFDLGAGYTFGDNGRYRFEGYVSNLTDEQREQAIIITGFDNLRFFSRPRTYGARLRVKL